MLYLDASVLVPMVALEVHTTRVQAWLASRARDQLCTSAWADIEVAAALAAKVRAGALTEVTKREADRLYVETTGRTFRRLEVGEVQMREALRLAQMGAPGLRGADALHLGVAHSQGATLCTLDKRQADAGEGLGVAVERL